MGRGQVEQVLQAKQGNFQALCYNSWFGIPFPPTAWATPGVAVEPLGLNHKIIDLAYTLHPLTTVGPCSVNVVLGTGAYEGAGAHSSYQFADLGGTFQPNDKVTITIAGVAYTIMLTSRFTGSLATIAQQIVIDLSFNAAFRALYRINSLGAEFVIQTLSYSTATPTFVVSTNSVAGTITAGGATMVAGVAGALPTQPILDQTYNGQAPSGTAVAGNALFPVDIILPAFNLANNGLTGVIYCIENFDAIWPYASTLEFVSNNLGGGAATMVSTLYSVPVDNHRFLPATLPQGFQITSEIL